MKLDKRVKKLLMTIRAAALMIAKGLELFIAEMEEDGSEIVKTTGESVTITHT